MNLLFLHQNFPAQYRYLAPALARQGHRVVFLTDQRKVGAVARQEQGVTLIGYAARRPPARRRTNHYLADTEAAVRRGQAAARALWQLRQQGFTPDVICCHPGWGEGLFLREVCPEAKLLYYFEFFYPTRGLDLDFDAEFPAQDDERFRARIKNSVNLLSLDLTNASVTPTAWQQSLFPAWARASMAVIHDGIDTAKVRPDAGAAILLGDRLQLGVGDPLVTFVNRNLEPYRGFHVFMRALPALQRRHPHAHVVILGGDEVSYGRAAPHGRSWRQHLLLELEGQLDLSRIHFVGKIPYGDFVRLMQASRAHVYLTYPFVLSWSLLEAMSAGALVIGSRTPPVEEVIEHGHNGLLVDFFDTQALVDTLVDALEQPQRFTALRARARETIIARYDLHRVCLPRQQALIARLAQGASGVGAALAEARAADPPAAPIAPAAAALPAAPPAAPAQPAPSAGSTRAARRAAKAQARRTGRARQGRHAAAAAPAAQTGADPAQAQCHAALMALFQRAAYADMITQAQTALVRWPQWAFGWGALGAALAAQGQAEAAREPLERARALAPADVMTGVNLGKVYKDLGRLDDSEALLRAALAQVPDHFDAHNNLGCTLEDAGRLSEAVVHYRRAVALKPEHAVARNNLGAALFELGETEPALAELTQAIRLAPSLPQAHVTRLGVLEALNRLDAQRKALAEARAHCGEQPDFAIAEARLAMREGEAERARTVLEQMPAPKTAKQASVRAFLLGALRDRAGESEGAMAAFVEANAWVRQRADGRRADKARYLKCVAEMQHLLEPAAPARWPQVGSNDGRAPVFLLGFPRSGTTLLGAILGSHSRVIVAEEPPTVENRLAQIAERVDDLATSLTTLTNDQVKALREAYWADFAQHVAGGAVPIGAETVCIDEMPLNTVWLALLRIMFPDARYLFALRHPCDVVLSGFMQNFSLNHAMANFLDLGDAARLYDQVMTIWQRANAIWDLPVQVVRYEDLISDLEGTLRPVLDFLGLEWEPALSDYVATARKRDRVKTASYHQVVQPLYTHARGRWERYRWHLEPVLPILAPWVEAFGYPPLPGATQT